MITLENITSAKPTIGGPTKGPWSITDSGKVIPFDSKHESLDWIADIQTAPNGQRNIPIICASSLMFDALKMIAADKKNRLSKSSREALQEALTAAE